MQRHWKRYLLLIVLAMVLAYIGWRAYADYQLRAYTRQIADSIPIPVGAEKVKEENKSAEKCRAVYIYRYYVTDTDWEEIVAFYRNYVESSFWKPEGGEMNFSRYFNAHESINFSLAHIQTTYTNDPNLAALAQEKTVFSVQVAYLQDERLFDTVCKSED